MASWQRVRQGALLLLLVLSSLPLRAETLYVTDRIQLGLHKSAAESSPVIQTIASGTAVTVMTRQEDFIKVKLADGTEGWANAAYLKQDEPATVELDALHGAHEKLKNTNAALKKQLAELERDLQVKRDQLSNAQTTIEELKQAKPSDQTTAAQPAKPDPAIEETREELAKAEQTIDELKAEIETLEQDKQQVEQLDQNKLSQQLKQLKEHNKALEGRIELALASLEGRKLPSPEELSAIRPSFPLWYWLLLFGALVLGAIVGLLWLDHRHRQRHGGFRV